MNDIVHTDKPQSTHIIWSSIASVVAVVVSVISLGFTIYSDSTTRECEFRYETYGRLNNLWTTIRDKELEIATFKEQIREHIEGSAIVPETSDRLLKEYLASHGARIEETMWELELHRFSISKKDISDIQLNYDDVFRFYRALLEKMETGSAGESEVNSALMAADRFWSNVKRAISSTQTSTAEEIRESCQ